MLVMWFPGEAWRKYNTQVAMIINFFNYRSTYVVIDDTIELKLNSTVLEELNIKHEVPVYAPIS